MCLCEHIEGIFEDKTQPGIVQQALIKKIYILFYDRWLNGEVGVGQEGGKLNTAYFFALVSRVTDYCRFVSINIKAYG
jgi:hypothetical protein